jgi:hypothetical protein
MARSSLGISSTVLLSDAFLELARVKRSCLFLRVIKRNYYYLLSSLLMYQCSKQHEPMGLFIIYLDAPECGEPSSLSKEFHLILNQNANQI